MEYRPSVPQFMRRAKCQHRQLSLPTADHRHLVAPKIRTHLRHWSGTCSRCIWHGGIRVGMGRVVVFLSRRLRYERLPFIVSRGRDRASPRRHGCHCVLSPPSIHAHSTDRGSMVRAPHIFLFGQQFQNSVMG